MSARDATACRLTAVESWCPPPCQPRPSPRQAPVLVCLPRASSSQKTRAARTCHNFGLLQDCHSAKSPPLDQAQPMPPHLRLCLLQGYHLPVVLEPDPEPCIHLESLVVLSSSLVHSQNFLENFTIPTLTRAPAPWPHPGTSCGAARPPHCTRRRPGS